MSPDYSRAQALATKLLLRQDIHSLFIDVSTFRLEEGVVLDSFQHYCALTKRPLTDFTCPQAQECCVLRLGAGHSLILYNEALPHERRRHWGLAHEVGHLYLNHRTDGPAQEAEANAFASQLLLPAAVLLQLESLCGGLTAELITTHFNASYDAARRRIESLACPAEVTPEQAAMDRTLLQRYTPLLLRALSRRAVRRTPVQSVRCFQAAEKAWLFSE